MSMKITLARFLIAVFYVCMYIAVHTYVAADIYTTVIIYCMASIQTNLIFQALLSLKPA